MCMSKKVRHLEELAIAGTRTLVCTGFCLCAGGKQGGQESGASYWIDCACKHCCLRDPQ